MVSVLGCGDLDKGRHSARVNGANFRLSMFTHIAYAAQKEKGLGTRYKKGLFQLNSRSRAKSTCPTLEKSSKLSTWCHKVRAFLILQSSDNNFSSQL